MLSKYIGTAGHTLATIAAMIAADMLGYSAVIAGALTVAYWLGREMAQAEYRYMSMHRTNRAEAPWWMSVHPAAWDIKSVLDWALPAGAVAVWRTCSHFLQWVN